MKSFHQPLLFRRAAQPLLPTLVCIAWLGLTFGNPCAAQAQGKEADNAASLQQLQSEIRELKDLVLQLQQQMVARHAESIGACKESEVPRAAEPAAIDEQSPACSSSGTAQFEQRLDHIEEDQQLLSEAMKDQYQTKVESASKYPVRLSGLVLFNLFGNSGLFDNQDVPTWVLGPTPGIPHGSTGATLRQSIIGLETFGPDLWGAHTSANVNLDFAGGFPGIANGVDSALVRLRTAAIRLDWQNTSIIAGQDQLFLAPLSPTSFASVIVPPLTWAGNLWAWTPQLRVEHRFALTGNSKMTLQAGFLDSLDGEPPDDNNVYVWFRNPSAGEQTRQPAYATRVAYSHPFFEQTLTIGAGAYYSRQNWGFDRIVNGWAGTMDLDLPLGRRFTLSGAFYRGSALGGLNAALGRSVLFNGVPTDAATQVIPLNVVGGWGQLKFRASPKLEFNVAFGQDSPFAADVRRAGDQANAYGPPFITANRQAFGNLIYRPRSDLLLSLEYRRLRTFDIFDDSFQAGQVNMAVGVLF